MTNDLITIFERNIKAGRFCIHPHSWLKLAIVKRRFRWDKSDVQFGNLRIVDIPKRALRKTLDAVPKRTASNYYLVNTDIARDYEAEIMTAKTINERLITSTFQALNPEFSSEKILNPNCRIDLYSENEFIEVKKKSNWKHALGQVLTYRYELKNHKATIILFGDSQCPRDLEYIEKVCNEYYVAVSYISKHCLNNEFLLRTKH